ncbi:uncharacterized protein LOC127751453 [Frankliniella occidentalis]|uniref:Uncharacterized protein LOC127751453 n=1 Tax=Frankliniella occidentalis TaxID=133901 RepID=A0A9C6X832_FRAOC|nr:uncharacterized protein LOC127751453 [Frankliniella occidentalis]
MDGLPTFPPAPPRTETNTSMEKLLLCHSASVHQRHPLKVRGRHSRQCTTIAALCFAKLCTLTSVPYRTCLNSIIEEGDEYYVKCVQTQGLPTTQLNCDELLTTFNINGLVLEVNIDQVGEGQVKDSVKKNLSAVLKAVHMYPVN